MTSLKSRFAGSFYPAEPSLLKKQIFDFLSNTAKVVTHPKALLVPHAGYLYSGQTAAHGYKQLVDENYKTAIILGPTHQVYSNSLSLPSQESFDTPLGNINFATEICHNLLSNPNVFAINSAPHYQEHSLEVQLPFLKYLFPEIEIVPISVGATDLETFSKAGEIIASLYTPDTILLISSDLSHFHSLNVAKEKDAKTIGSIMKMDLDCFIKDYQNNELECCGVYPLILAFSIFKSLVQLHPTLLHYDTSATAASDTHRVVGYCSIAFT